MTATRGLFCEMGSRKLSACTLFSFGDLAVPVCSSYLLRRVLLILEQRLLRHTNF